VRVCLKGDNFFYLFYSFFVYGLFFFTHFCSLTECDLYFQKSVYFFISLVVKPQWLVLSCLQPWLLLTRQLQKVRWIEVWLSGLGSAVWWSWIRALMNVLPQRWDFILTGFHVDELELCSWDVQREDNENFWACKSVCVWVHGPVCFCVSRSAQPHACVDE